MRRRCCYLVLLLLLGTMTPSEGQTASGGIDSPDTLGKEISGQAQTLSRTVTDKAALLQQLPGSYLNKVTAKTRQFNRRITKRTAKALSRLQKQEEKIYARLSKVDSLAAHNLLTGSIDSLSRLKDLVKGKLSALADKIPGKQYIPYLDTLKNSLHFLDKYQDKLGAVKGLSQLKAVSGRWSRLQNSLSSVQQAEGRLNQLDDIQQYITQQQASLKQSLSAYGDLFNKYLGRFSKEAYYYKAQVANYKEMWQHPDQAEAQAMEILNKVPAFQHFMKEHSMLAGLFSLPQNYGSAQNLEGLQTRAMVEQEIRQRLQAMGADGRSRVQEQMAAARQQLQQLKDKLPGGGSTTDMPDFKPNDLKSKTLFQRLEYGANVQFSRADNYYPTTSDMAAQIAYKFSDKGSAGIGAAFKLGWGSNIRKIRFTAQGLGLRSFLDYKLKGTFYANGGFEFNFTRTIPNLPALRELNGWTRSALLGIERKYKISDKVNGNMMLLFDFLYKQHTPQTQPIVFRVGYNF